MDAVSLACLMVMEVKNISLRLTKHIFFFFRPRSCPLCKEALRERNDKNVKLQDQGLQGSTRRELLQNG
jgi:hypothetical protein